MDYLGFILDMSCSAADIRNFNNTTTVPFSIVEITMSAQEAHKQNIKCAKFFDKLFKHRKPLQYDPQQGNYGIELFSTLAVSQANKSTVFVFREPVDDWLFCHFDDIGFYGLDESLRRQYLTKLILDVENNRTRPTLRLNDSILRIGYHYRHNKLCIVP